MFELIFCTLFVGGTAISAELPTINERYDDLQTAFNAAQGKVRLLAILSPG